MLVRQQQRVADQFMGCESVQCFIDRSPVGSCRSGNGSRVGVVARADVIRS